MCPAIVIAVDGKDEWAEGLPLSRNWEAMSKEEILTAIQQAGIVGMGGATFPAHIKLKPQKVCPSTAEIRAIRRLRLISRPLLSTMAARSQSVSKITPRSAPARSTAERSEAIA